MSLVIKSLHGRQILDSRGNPTVEAEITLSDGSFGRAAVPSGASTGAREAIEERDHDPNVYGGLGVLEAVSAINTTIATALNQKEADQAPIDRQLIELDGTPTKSRLGANAILAVSLALAHALAANRQLPLYQSLKQSEPKLFPLPVPLMNIVNGGKHAAHSTDIQEFMIIPTGAASFAKALEMGDEIFHALHLVLDQKGYPTTVGDEGGYAPPVKHGNREALDLITQAIAATPYRLGQDVFLGIDVAASELVGDDGRYRLQTEHKELTADAMIDWLADLAKNYPILSIEDGLGENDWAGWQALTKRLGGSMQLVGDDLFVTNTTYLKRGITEQSANAILIKPNQIGTLTETEQAVAMAQAAGFKTVMSHRSGETEDVTISHLAVGLETRQIKAGSLSRTDRIAKYNELLRIEEELGDRGYYPGRQAFRASSI